MSLAEQRNSQEEVAGWGGGEVAAAGTLKAVLGSRHAYQRNTASETIEGTTSCEDWVPRAEKGLDCCTTNSWAHCLTHNAQWRFTEGEEEGQRCLLGGVWETSTLLMKEDAMTCDAGFRGSSWELPTESLSFWHMPRTCQGSEGDGRVRHGLCWPRRTSRKRVRGGSSRARGR